MATGGSKRTASAVRAGVASVTVEQGVTELLSRDAEALLRRWLAEDAALSDLEVRPLSLEEAFLSLTARPAAATALETAA